MSKRKPKFWGIWVTSIKEWMTTSGGKKARYKLRREAAKDADDFNTAWRGRKHIYEVRKIGR
jgi:hypothetical protein